MSAALSMEFLVSKATRGRVDYPTSETWYKMMHKKVCPVTVTGMPTNGEEEEIRVEAEKVFGSDV